MKKVNQVQMDELVNRCRAALEGDYTILICGETPPGRITFGLSGEDKVVDPAGFLDCVSNASLMIAATLLPPGQQLFVKDPFAETMREVEKLENPAPPAPDKPVTH